MQDSEAVLSGPDSEIVEGKPFLSSLVANLKSERAKLLQLLEAL
jgi:hypothetical protein